MDFIEHLDGAITVTNADSEIIYMNKKADSDAPFYQRLDRLI
jgi:hypothetical protein